MKGFAMPRFAANLTMMFNEVAFPLRFEAAAKAGFSAVEFLFPYDYAPADVAGWLAGNELRNVLFNMPPGDWAAGERGIASLPERNEPDDGEVNYRYLFRLLDELGYAGWVGCEYRPRGKTVDGLGWLKTLACGASGSSV